MNNTPAFTAHEWTVAKALGVGPNRLSEKLAELKKAMTYDDLIAHVERKAKLKVGRTWLHYRIHGRPEG